MSTSTPQQVSTWSAVSTVAQREIKVRLSSKAFVWSAVIITGVILLAGLFGPRIPELFAGDDDQIGVVSTTEETVAALPDTETTLYGSRDEAVEAIENGDVPVAVVGDAQNGLEVLGLRDAPNSLIQALSVSPQVTILDPDAPHPGVLYFVAFGFGIVYFMSVISFGNVIGQSVLEEKESRIVEILLATVPARAILTGKIVGISVLAIGQIMLYALAGYVGIAVNGETLNITGLSAPIFWFVILFAMAFVLFAALYAAVASMVSRTEDLASATTPLTFLVMVPYFAIIMFYGDQQILDIMSYVPITAPVAVPVQIYTGQFGWVEATICAVILLVTTVLALWFASTVYRRSILRTGRKVKWSEVFARA